MHTAQIDDKRDGPNTIRIKEQHAQLDTSLFVDKFPFDLDKTFNNMCDCISFRSNKLRYVQGILAKETKITLLGRK